MVYCSCPKGKQLDWNKSFVRRGTEQATEPQPWDPAFLGSHPFSSALTAISLYRRNQKKKKKSVHYRRREGGSRKGASPLSSFPDLQSSAPELQYFPLLVIAGLSLSMLELPVGPRAVVAFAAQLSHLTLASSQPQTPHLFSRKEPNDAGFSGHFLTTIYPFCSSLQAKH